MRSPRMRVSLGSNPIPRIPPLRELGPRVQNAPLGCPAEARIPPYQDLDPRPACFSTAEVPVSKAGPALASANSASRWPRPRPPQALPPFRVRSTQPRARPISARPRPTPGVGSTLPASSAIPPDFAAPQRGPAPQTPPLAEVPLHVATGSAPQCRLFLFAQV